MNDNLTPKAIVAALDAHIIGQKDAKRAVAVALRNRWRRPVRWWTMRRMPRHWRARPWPWRRIFAFIPTIS